MSAMAREDVTVSDMNEARALGNDRSAARQ
jgi:hypothetical protein